MGCDLRNVGCALLWLVILSTFVKVPIQIELAKWSITTGQTGLTGFNRVPPRVGRGGWMTWLWLLMAIAKITQMGGVVGGTAVALSMLFPFGGDPLNKTTLTIWTIAVIASRRNSQILWIGVFRRRSVGCPIGRVVRPVCRW